ncbi:MAG: putative quinol monooxygenase [Segniliparus sp.]|uniref:putative quinol monooxygenase n=1 Tax=Segniliparus sp. TaxID=2804064 RepID=UPI003F3053F4
MMLAFLMDIQVQPGKEANAVSVLLGIQKIARSSIGCPDFIWLQHTNDHTRLTLFERWDSKARLDAHIKQTIPARDQFLPTLCAGPASEPVVPVGDRTPR